MGAGSLGLVAVWPSCLAEQSTLDTLRVITACTVLDETTSMIPRSLVMVSLRARPGICWPPGNVKGSKHVFVRVSSLTATLS